jgi:hypothetical protein
MRFPQAPANAVDMHLVSGGEGAQEHARSDWETRRSPEWAVRACDGAVGPIRGFVTEADLPQAEKEWPGLRAFLEHLPIDQRPATFLELVWRFECFLARSQSA